MEVTTLHLCYSALSMGGSYTCNDIMKMWINTGSMSLKAYMRTCEFQIFNAVKKITLDTMAR